MTTQNLLKLPDITYGKHKGRDYEHVPEKREKIFCDTLKRQAVRVMADVTECNPVSMSAQMARLNGLIEVIADAIRYRFVPGPDTLRSDAQLAHPQTLVDYLECLKLTRSTHRAPSFVNSRDSDIADIKHMICSLAGLVSNNSAAMGLFLSQNNIEETEEQKYA
jgi:hypothetical protein